MSESTEKQLYLLGLINGLRDENASLITTIETQKEEIEKMRYCLNSIANRQIGVIGEGFGYDFHYKNLRDSAKKCLSSLSQEGEK